MTTRITVHAGHGWPVVVKGTNPANGAEIIIGPGRVPAGETMDFHIHSGLDLHIHEVQPDEATDDEIVARLS